MRIRYAVLVLALLCFVNLFVNNGYKQPDIMEARNLITARELAQQQNWLSPSMNGYPRLAKPPLPSWINGVLAQWVPVSELAVHRIPNGLIACGFVIAAYFLLWVLTGHRQSAFLAAGVSATSFYLLLMGRQASWDIYCYAFMAMAIAALLYAGKQKSRQLPAYGLAGLFLGLSFMSKGPVAFYGMLLPFLLAALLFRKKLLLRFSGKGLAICILLLLVVGFSWPLYQLITNYETLKATLEAEARARVTHNVKPFYQYWGFWSHVGVWSVLALAGLWYPYAKKRIPSGQYGFLLSWTLLTVLFLSLIPEKKERYILPVVLPLALLVAQLLYSLFQRWQVKTLSSSDRWLIRLNSGIIGLACLGIPVFLFGNGLQNNWAYFSALAFFFCAALCFTAFLRLNPRLMALAMGLSMSFVSLLLIPARYQLQYKNPNYTSPLALQAQAVYKLPFYSQNLNPREVYALGKAVDSLHYLGSKILPPKQHEFALLSYHPLSPDSLNFLTTEFQLMDTLHYNPEEARQLLYVYKVKAAP